MACCVALTLIFAWLHRALGWMLPRRGDDEFAPPATWPPPARSVSAAPARRPTGAVARVCVVVGISWFVAGFLAMHVFGVLAPIRSLPADVIFHASGLWLATAGTALHLLPTRPTRSTA